MMESSDINNLYAMIKDVSDNIKDQNVVKQGVNFAKISLQTGKGHELLISDYWAALLKDKASQQIVMDGLVNAVNASNPDLMTAGKIMRVERESVTEFAQDDEKKKKRADIIIYTTHPNRAIVLENKVNAKIGHNDMEVYKHHAGETFKRLYGEEGGYSVIGGYLLQNENDKDKVKDLPDVDIVDFAITYEEVFDKMTDWNKNNDIKDFKAALKLEPFETVSKEGVSELIKSTNEMNDNLTKSIVHLQKLSGAMFYTTRIFILSILEALSSDFQERTTTRGWWMTNGPDERYNVPWSKAVSDSTPSAKLEVSETSEIIKNLFFNKQEEWAGIVWAQSYSLNVEGVVIDIFASFGQPGSDFEPRDMGNVTYSINGIPEGSIFDGVDGPKTVQKVFNMALEERISELGIIEKIKAQMFPDSIIVE